MIELMLLGAKNLKRERVRSLLTIIGIVIGVATVFTLVSTSIGTEKFLKQQFEKFGANKIIILPGSTETSLTSALTGRPFGKRELESVSKISGVEIVAGLGYRSMEVEYKGKKIVTMVTGAPIINFKKLFEEVQGYELESGRYPRKNRKETVLGSLMAKKVLGKEIRVGSSITINGEKFKVVGIMKEIGSRHDDTAVLIPYSVFEKLTGEKDSYDMLLVGARENADLSSLVEKIKRTLKGIRGSEDFSVLTSQQLFQRVSSILGVMSIVLLVIAVVSLVVGAIGVMNTMYMSVTERTKEIGILKSIGATNSQVFTIFLTEASLLGLIGGVLGIAVGVGVAHIVEVLAMSAGITLFRAYLGIDLFLGSLLFSTLLGAISGFLPAKRAANMDPVEALRYE